MIKTLSLTFSLTANARPSKRRKEKVSGKTTTFPYGASTVSDVLEFFNLYSTSAGFRESISFSLQNWGPSPLRKKLQESARVKTENQLNFLFLFRFFLFSQRKSSSFLTPHIWIWDCEWPLIELMMHWQVALLFLCRSRWEWFRRLEFCIENLHKFAIHEIFFQLLWLLVAGEW